MHIHKPVAPKTQSVGAAFADNVVQGAKDFATAVDVVANLRGLNKSGPVVAAAGEAINVTRKALADVLASRFSELMTLPELQLLKSADKIVADAHKQLETLAFPAGVVPQESEGAPYAQIREMKAQAISSGQTFGRMISDRPLVVGPDTDVDAALKQWQAAPTAAQSPQVDTRHDEEQIRTLTASVPAALTNASDRKVWSLMQQHFPRVHVNQRDNGKFYVGGLPDRKTDGMLGPINKQDGDTIAQAVKSAMTGLQKVGDCLVSFPGSSGRQEVTWSANRNDWVPHGEMMSAILTDVSLSPLDRKTWDTLTTQFPRVEVKERPDGSFYVSGLPDRVENSMVGGIRSDGRSAQQAMESALRAMTKPHECIVSRVDGERREQTWSAKDAAWRPYRAVLTEEAELAKSLVKGDARAALGVLHDVPADVALSVLLSLSGGTHTSEAHTAAGAAALLAALRTFGDSVPHLEAALQGLAKDVQKAAVTLALETKPTSPALQAFASKLADT